MSTIRIGEGSVGFIRHSGADLESAGDSMFRYSGEGMRRSHRERGLEGNFRQKTLRRLRGFVVEDRGREFKVAFVPEGRSDEKIVYYFLPADLLRHAGVTAENQQFELDEKIAKFRDGSVAVTYHVRPSAQANEGYVDPLDLDESRRDKLTALLKKLGHAEV